MNRILYNSKKISDLTKLWVEWGKIVNIGNGIVDLEKIKFSGPVLLDCMKFENQGHIFLDLTKHFVVVIPRPYIIKMEWDGVISQDTKQVKIKSMKLYDGDLGFLNKLKLKDKLLIDCSGHHSDDEAAGKYRLTFESLLYNQYGFPYNVDEK